jgi:hypothetical protein
LIELPAEQKAKYDLNNDGEITTADALIILRIAAGLPAVTVGGAGGGGGEFYVPEQIPEPLQPHDYWSVYLNFSSHRQWPDGSLWRGLDGTFPVRSYPLPTPPDPNYIPPPESGSGGQGGSGGGGGWIPPPNPVLPNFKNLGELFEMFLSQEHRLNFMGANYSYAAAPGIEAHGADIDFIEDNAEKSRPVLSLLSTLRNITFFDREAHIDDMYFWSNMFVYGWIDIGISGVYGLRITIWPWDEILVTVGGYDGFFTSMLEKGTFEKLLAYLLYIQ